jgi:hypothetical protein
MVLIVAIISFPLQPRGSAKRKRRIAASHQAAKATMGRGRVLMWPCTPSKPIFCDLCSAKLNSLAELDVHNSKCHPGIAADAAKMIESFVASEQAGNHAPGSNPQ